MAPIVRPSKLASFSSLKAIPVDRLDAQIANLISAIQSTQAALADIRRDDGQLRVQPVLSPAIRAELEAMESRILSTGQAIAGTAAQISNVTQDVSLLAKDAENAAVIAVRAAGEASLSHVSALQAISARAVDDETAEQWSTDSENWATYSQAHAENSEAQQEQSAAWAEYLAGPVVTASNAPAYAQSTPYGHGLYYQPVEGGLAGLWSAKWWALQAQQYVGNWNFFYLGPWAEPPFPGSTNPDTGVTPPSPLLPGSFYYNTENHQLYIWDGTQWTTPYTLTPAYQDNFVYVATAGQTVFSGPDKDGKTPLITDNDSDIHLNGVKLVIGMDYTITKATSSLTLAAPVAANSIVQWDLLVEASALAPGAISVFKIQIAPAPDGVNRNFTMTYTNPTLGSQPVNAGNVGEIMISQDGIVQEPAVDFTASAAALTFATAPLPNCRLWGTWHASDLIIP